MPPSVSTLRELVLGRVVVFLSACTADTWGLRSASISLGLLVLAAGHTQISEEKRAGGVHTARAPVMLAFSLASSIGSNFLAGPSGLILLIGAFLLILSPAVPYCVSPGYLPCSIAVVAHVLVFLDLC